MSRAFQWNVTIIVAIIAAVLNVSAPAFAASSDGFVSPLLGLSQTGTQINTSYPVSDGYNETAVSPSYNEAGTNSDTLKVWEKILKYHSAGHTTKIHTTLKLADNTYVILVLDSIYYPSDNSSQIIYKAIKTNSYGDILWEKNVFNKGIKGFSPRLVDMIPTSDGGFAVAIKYEYVSSLSGGYAYLYKLDSYGQVVWWKDLGYYQYGLSSEYHTGYSPMALVDSSDGNIAVICSNYTGWTDFYAGQHNLQLIKYGYSGNQLLNKSIGNSSENIDYNKNTKLLAQNGSYVFMYNRTDGLSLMGINSAGDIIWTKDRSLKTGKQLMQLPPSNFLLLEADAINSLDSAGNVEWSVGIDGVAGNELIKASNGYIYDFSNNSNYNIAKISDSGSAVWTKQIDNDLSASTIEDLSNGSFLLFNVDLSMDLKIVKYMVEGIYGTVMDNITKAPLEYAILASGNTNSVTDWNGKYFYEISSGSTHEIEVKHERYQTGHATITLNNGEILKVDINLLVSLSGTVSDMSTGIAIPYVTVAVTGGATRETGWNGYWAMGSLPPGSYDITFTKSGYGNLTLTGVVVNAGEETIRNVGLTTPGVLSITTSSSLPRAETGTPYTQTIRIKGGSWPYTFNAANGSALPPGLTLDSASGTISGTAIQNGSFTFSIGVTDSQGIYAEREFNIAVTTLLAITSSGFPKGTTNTNYSSAITAIGGTPPYKFESTSQHFYKSYDVTYANGFTWYEARDYCIQDGGYLMSITSLAENATATSSQSQWIGLTDEGHEGTWTWITGEALTFTRWSIGEPNSGTNSNCAVNTDGKWFDYNCSNKLDRFHCEYEYVAPKVYLRQDGTLSGTPTESGSYTFTARVTDASGDIAEKELTLLIENALAIATTRLNDGITGASFDQTLTASGGSGTYTWGVYSGTLPPGLSLDVTTGMITGNPTEAGSSIVVLSVRDGIGRIALKQLTVNILTGLQIVTSVMPNGYAGNSYSEAVRISGGIAPFTYTVSGGSALPDGLTLNQNTGIISGTASFGGLTNVQITVADSSFPTRQTREKILGLRIWSQLTIISSAVLPNARKNVALSPVTLVAKGGTSPYTWSVSSGFLPDGLSLDPGTGRLSGTPKDRGDFVFTIRCSDGSATAAIVEKQFFIHISDALAVTTGAVPGGATGLPYSASLAASGGLKPYGWGVKAGTLPPGLSLDSATGAITGTPTAKTTSSVIFEVTDGDAPAQQAQKSLFFEVSDTLTIYDAILPNSRLNQPYHANVRAQLGTPPYSWRIASGTLPPGITLGQDAGIATLQGTAQTAGSYALELEVSDNGTPVQQVSRSYTVIVHPEIAISTSALKTAVRGAPYVDAVAASGGAPPYTYSIVAGTLPAGLTFNSSTGDIYGSVNLSAGQSALLTVRATDGGYPSAYVDKEFSISAIDPLAISTATLQGALQKSSYGPVSLAASGGLSPYSWTLANSSTLPQGVALSSAGVLSGTPVLCGSFPFSVQAADSSVIANTSQKAYSLVVTCANDYDLAGSLGADGAGATVTLSGPQSKTATADASGNYLFQHLVNGSYTVTPAKAQRWFSPVSRTLTVENLDLGSIGFSTTIDGTGPTVSAFTVPAAVNSTSVPISALSAADNAGGSGLAAYLISESATAPLAAAAGWSATKPATFTIATGVDGDRTLYAFAKDGAGNVSSGRSATVKLDTTAPTVSAFTIPLTVNNTRSVTITTLAVSDAAGGSGVSAYLLSETSAIPTAVDSRWSAVKPTSYTFTSDGVHTLRAFVKDQVGNISAPAGAAVTNTYTLTVALTGSGSGSVNSTPTGIACANGSSAGCSSNFTGGATVNLTATAGAYSAFGGWSGICSGNGGCTAGMDAARTVTATFAPLPRARIAGTTPAYYFTLQAAYNAATDGAVIQLLEGSFTETLTANRPIRVTVKGGYKAGYGAVSSETVLQRQIVLRAGTVRMEKVFVK